MSNFKKLVASALVVMSIAFVIFLNQRANPVEGSVQFASEYQATTTDAGTPQWSVLSSTGGSLGSVVITGVGTGGLTIYDASTTRSTGWATTTLAVFKASAPAGTYTFDVAARQGILIEFNGTGTRASSTITFRQN